DRAVSRLFNDLVGTSEQRRRHFEAERFCGLEIDYKLEFGRLQHRQVGRLFPVHNSSSIATSLSIRVYHAGSVAHQASPRRNVDVSNWRKRPQDHDWIASGTTKREIVFHSYSDAITRAPGRWM